MFFFYSFEGCFYGLILLHQLLCLHIAIAIQITCISQYFIPSGRIQFLMNFNARSPLKTRLNQYKGLLGEIFPVSKSHSSVSSRDVCAFSDALQLHADLSVYFRNRHYRWILYPEGSSYSSGLSLRECSF